MTTTTPRQRKARMIAPVPVVMPDAPPSIPKERIDNTAMFQRIAGVPAASLPAVIPPALKPLDELATAINAEFKALDGAEVVVESHRVAAGRMLKEVRERLPKEHTFTAWCGRSIKRSKADIYRCLKLVSNDTPAAVAQAVKTERKTAAASMRKTDDKRKAAASQSFETKPAVPATFAPQPDLTAQVLAHAAAAITVPWEQVIDKNDALMAMQTCAAELMRLTDAGRTMKLSISVAIEEGIAAVKHFLNVVVPNKG